MNFKAITVTLQIVCCEKYTCYYVIRRSQYLKFPTSWLKITDFFSSPVLPSLIDRLGDAKDQVRDQDQTLLMKIMEQAATPQVVFVFI